MISGVPNTAYGFGYRRASWTLPAGLLSDLVRHLLVDMQERGATVVVATLRPEDADTTLRPWADPENVNPGYVMRSVDREFKPGDGEPWTHLLGYAQERTALPAVDLETHRWSTGDRAHAAPCYSHPRPRGDLSCPSTRTSPRC